MSVDYYKEICELRKSIHQLRLDNMQIKNQLALERIDKRTNFIGTVIISIQILTSIILYLIF